MKKYLIPSLLCTIALATSCGDTSYEHHQTTFYPLRSEGMILYADQEKDTTHIISYDSWTASVSDSWLSVSPTEGKVTANAYADTKLIVTAQPNTTGAVRSSYLIVNAYDQVAMPVRQYYWLNITRPAAIITSTDVTTSKATESDYYASITATFPMNVTAAAADTSVVFTVYRDKATLVPTDSWIKPEESTFAVGQHTVKLALEANTTAESRTGTLTLTSGGISTPIIIVQAAK